MIRRKGKGRVVVVCLRAEGMILRSYGPSHSTLVSFLRFARALKSLCGRLIAAFSIDYGEAGYPSVGPGCAAVGGHYMGSEHCPGSNGATCTIG